LSIRRKLLSKLLSLCFAASIFAACSPWFVIPNGQLPSPTLPTTTPQVSPSVTLKPIITASPTASATPRLPTPSVTPQATPRLTTRLPSGWSLYSNPDYVKGIALYQNHLWAATLGGVVDWNIDTQSPVVYTTRDGLVEIQGNDVVACPMPDVRILVSHETGILSAYDLGLKKWSHIPITFNDGTTLKGVRSLRCDANNNRLLAGSEDGLGILNLKTMRWERVGAKEGLNVLVIKAIDVVGQAIWLAAGKQSAFMVLGKSIFPFNGASGFPSGSVNDLSVAADSSIWFGYPTGLVHYRDKRWYSYGSQSPTGGIPFISIDQVEVGPNKMIWIASAEEGVCPFDPVTLFCSTIYPAPQDAPISDLIVGDNGIAYAATNGGGILVLKADKTEKLILNRQKLLSNDVLDIAEGPDGNLWVATDHGVNYFNPNQTLDTWEKILPDSKGLNFSRVSGVFPVPAGVWFTNDEEPQVSFKGDSGWLNLGPSRGISGRVLATAIDQRGYIWFATDKGVDIWDGVTMRSYGPDTGLTGNVYHALLEENGTMWLGTDQGLLRYERYQWSVALPGIAINAIARGEGDSLLLGSEKGLIVYQDGQSYQWLINLGDEVLADTSVTALARDKRGDLWVGTASEGLFHFDGHTWELFNTARGMPTNSIRKVFADHLGAVWVAAITGQGGGALVRFMP
jgi:ligand-binding sensor domain-containing protein